MKAITTRYVGPTNSRGSRIVASAEGVRAVSVPFAYEGDVYQAHEKAALALCKKYGWGGRLVGGGTKKGYVWVFADSGRDARRGSRSSTRRASRARSRRRR